MKSKKKYQNKKIYKFFDAKDCKVQEIKQYEKDPKVDDKIKVNENNYLYEGLLKPNCKNLVYKLKSLYKKNQLNVYNNQYIINAKLMNILISLPMLITSYKKVMKKTGAKTFISLFSMDKLNSLNLVKRSFCKKIFGLPDEMTKNLFLLTIKQLRKGEYSWGDSKEICLEKLGIEKEKYTIIAFFMDKIIEQAIRIILEVIYEPSFDKLNCSFGFRPGKNVQNAIYALTNKFVCNDLCTAIQGEIKSDYDKIEIKRIIKILNKKIKDNKFLNLVEKLLNYQYQNSDIKQYFDDKFGIYKKSGDLLPYLWNIYFHELDKEIIYKLENFIQKINKKKINNFENIKTNKEKIILKRLRNATKRIIYILNNTNNSQSIKKFFKFKGKRKENSLKEKICCLKHLSKNFCWKSYYINKQIDIKTLKYDLIKYKSKINSKLKNFPDGDSNKIKLKYLYARYANSFIILTNFNMKTLEKVKIYVKNYLGKELKAELDINKTKLTNLKKNSIKFLGFEIILPKKYNFNTKFIPTDRNLCVIPDRYNLLSRFVKRGYCDVKGFPKEIGNLSVLPNHIIIKRYNEVIRSIVLFYSQFIRKPKSNLARWLYIIRFSCYKTLAQKENTSIKNIVNKYKYKTLNKNSIVVKTKKILDGVISEKEWNLITLLESIEFADKKNILGRIMKTHWRLKKRGIVAYKQKINDIAISENLDKYLEKFAL